MMGFWNLLLGAIMPPLQVLIIACLGAFLATEYSGILSGDSRKILNKLVFYVFTPALVFGDLARTITFEDIISWWFMPVNIGIIFFCGTILGWVVVKITRPSPQLERLIIAVCSAGNFGNLLLIIIPSVCDEDSGVFGNRTTCWPLALSYASFSLAFGGFYTWTYTYNLIKTASAIQHEKANNSSRGDEEEMGLPNMDSYETITPLINESQIFRRLSDPSIRYQWLLKIKEIFAPSTIGAISGLIVGTIPWLKHMMIGESSPLGVIEDSANLLGQAAIPCVTIILGGNLLQGLQKSNLRASIIMAIILVKFFILPIIGIAVVKGVSQLGLVPNDPLFKYVLMVQFTVPPPQNIGTMVEFFRVGQEECSIIFLWTYLFAAVALALWSMIYIWMLII